MRNAFLAAAMLLVSGVGVAKASGQRTLTFEDRVAAQRAIEEVYWRHRIWPSQNPAPKPALSTVMPDDLLRARVSEYLKRSAALGTVWKRPITGEQLQAEMDRIAKTTRDQQVLQELFAALGHDPLVIAEVLARQTLVDRLIHSWYSGDSRFHGELRERIEAVVADGMEPHAVRGSGAAYSEETVQLESDAETRSGPRSSHRLVSPDAWQGLIDDLAGRFEPDLRSTVTVDRIPIGTLSSIEETAEGFRVIRILDRRADTLTLGTYWWPKQSFDSWWAPVSAAVNLEPGDVTHHFVLPSLTGSSCVPDSWTETPAPVDPLRWHTAIWTGSQMIVWGGNNGRPTNTGGRYDPLTGVWSPTSTGIDVPVPREFHTAVWTGTEMIVWGGLTDIASTNTGGRYNPSTDSWLPTSTGTNVPPARRSHSAIWTGAEMIVWGGIQSGFGPTNTGGRYDPTTDSWLPTSVSQHVPSPREQHTAVWTGTEMIIWGGFVAGGATNTGGRYQPASDTWIPSSLGTASGANAPNARRHHTAIWADTTMIIWGGGGISGPAVNTGGRYDPVTDSWLPTSTGANVPAPRSTHTAVWTGEEMIVWGPGDTGGRYNPLSDSWLATSTGANTPSSRDSHSAVWTGTDMIIWGGYVIGGWTNTGGSYRPDTDSWVSTSSDCPSARSWHTAIWTGIEMVIWGGGGDAPRTNTGGRYRPAFNDWSPTSTGVGVPSARNRHSAVWTGTEMIVWGGIDNITFNTGGRYNPATDSWATSSLTTGAGANVPIGRDEHSADWTGTEMIIWGGETSSGYTNTGGRYNPHTDLWLSTSLQSPVPSARALHASVWTGSELVIWGGGAYNESWQYFNDGARYDPGQDTWTATSTDPGVPDPRYGPTAVWTGSEMIVWGGVNGSGVLNTGGRYNPYSNDWAATSTGANVPPGRYEHSAVWTGGEVIQWGGYTQPGSTNTGGRYSPSIDSWIATSTMTALRPRALHSAVWTGTEMIVWGSEPRNTKLTSTGDRYCVSTCQSPSTWYQDHDGDGVGTTLLSHQACEQPEGFVATSGDCDDQHNAVFSGAPQLCDGMNNDCGDPSWPTVPANELNADGDSFRICEGDCDDSRPYVYPGAAETCNGIDDDCNATLDEGLGQTSCGTGACSRTVDNCVGGVAQACIPGLPEPESCNGLDDSCDGRIDEDGFGLDSDGDAITNACDNCRFAFNPDQLDADSDLVGSACDNCITSANPGQQDLDSDQRGDVCDNCPAAYNPPQDDFDVDRRGDACDNCVFDFNPPQSDFDHDGQGDFCDVNDGLIYVYSTDRNYIEWQDEVAPTSWNIYEGSLSVLKTSGDYTQVPGSNPLAGRTCGIAQAYVEDFETLPLGAAKFALVTGITAGIEGSLGTNSAGATRPNAHPCP